MLDTLIFNSHASISCFGHFNACIPTPNQCTVCFASFEHWQMQRKWRVKQSKCRIMHSNCASMKYLLCLPSFLSVTSPACKCGEMQNKCGAKVEAKITLQLCLKMSVSSLSVEECRVPHWQVCQLSLCLTGHSLPPKMWRLAEAKKRLWNTCYGTPGTAIINLLTITLQQNRTPMSPQHYSPPVYQFSKSFPQKDLTSLENGDLHLGLSLECRILGNHISDIFASFQMLWELPLKYKYIVSILAPWLFLDRFIRYFQVLFFTHKRICSWLFKA